MQLQDALARLGLPLDTGGFVFRPTFYSNAYVAVVGEDKAAPSIFVLSGDARDQIIRLTGDENDIEAANRMAGLQITEANAAQYLSFSLMFRIIGGEYYKITGDARVVEAGESSFRCATTVQHGASLFALGAVVHDNGRIDLSGMTSAGRYQ